MIVAPGWSAFAFKAAMSASSASTTIRSAFPFTLSPTVNCHDIFDLPQGYERALTGINRYLQCGLDLFVRGCGRVAPTSARTPRCTKIESGADAGSRGITCYMVRATRASCIGISQQWRASFRDGNSVTPAQVTSITVKDESMNLTDLADRQEFGSGLPAAECAFWAVRSKARSECAQLPLSRRSFPFS